MASRKIIHVDMDAFYASVEQRDVPRLKGKPVVVGGQPDSRGVVAACSYEARKFGVRSAMSCSQAYRLCPDAIFVRPRFDVYREVSQNIHAIFKRFTSVIEPLSLDEAFLDVSDVEFSDGSATAIAEAIRQMIFEELSLTASAGISYNKFLAKIASDENKPNGICVVTPEDALSFIAKLPIKKFRGVGKVTEAKMLSLGINTGADLRRCCLQELKKNFGKHGQYYYEVARGVDKRPVKAHSQRKSLGCERTYSTDLSAAAQIQKKLDDLANQLASMLAKRELKAKTVTLKIKFSDFSQITRSISEVDAFSDRETIDRLVAVLLEKLGNDLLPIRLLGLSASNLLSVSSSQHANYDQASIVEDVNNSLSDHAQLALL